MAVVRVMVGSVDEAIQFYTRILGFELVEHMGPPFARVSRVDLVVWLSGPQSSAARPMPDGRKPEPGGWNRFVLEVENIAATVSDLKKSGARFRNDIVSGPGGQQILVEDPFGNPVEIFQPRR